MHFHLSFTEYPYKKSKLPREKYALVLVASWRNTVPMKIA